MINSNAHRPSRTDNATASRIEEAVARIGERGAREVAESLAAAGVSFNVTVRVVSEPTRRRHIRSD